MLPQPSSLPKCMCPYAWTRWSWPSSISSLWSLHPLHPCQNRTLATPSTFGIHDVHCWTYSFKVLVALLTSIVEIVLVSLFSSFGHPATIVRYLNTVGRGHKKSIRQASMEKEGDKERRRDRERERERTKKEKNKYRKRWKNNNTRK